MNQSAAPSDLGLQQNNNRAILAANSNTPLQPVAPQQAPVTKQPMGMPPQVQYQPQQQPQHSSQHQQQPQQPQIVQQQQQTGYQHHHQQRQPQQQQQRQPQQQKQQPQMQQLSQHHNVAQVQHRQHLAQGYNGGWQSDSYMADRQKMIKKIVDLLKARKPNAPQDWLNKLPQMAKRLEDTLFKTAPNFESYNSPDTLKQRLQQLAMKMKQPRPHQQQQPHKVAQAQQPQMIAQNPPQQQVQQVQHPGQPNRQIVNQQGMVQMQGQQPQQIQSQVQPQQPTSQPQRRMVNMAEINSMANPLMSNPQHPNQNNSAAGVPATNTGLPQVSRGNYVQQGAVMNGGSGMSTAPAPGVVTQKTAAVANNSQQYQAARPSQAPAPDNGSRSRPNSDRAQVLRHQQQRLLLLRHAAKCPHEDGRCPVTPHCCGMKRLWKHIAECKNQKCQVPHCVSSRYVLSHYHRCKDVRCPVCGPVREAIHRSHEKQKIINQRNQNQLNQNPLKPGNNDPLNNKNVSQNPPLQSGPTAPQQQTSSLPQQQISSQPQQQISAQHQQHLDQRPPQQMVQPPNKRQRLDGNPIKSATVPHLPQQQQSMDPVGTKPIHTSSSVVQQGYAFPPRSTSEPNPPTSVPTRPVEKPQEDLTLINCFTIDQIEKHIASLNQGLKLPAAKLKTRGLEVLKVLSSHQHGWVFNTPVDPVELGLPDYFHVIKRPMDLGTIKKRLENGCLSTLEGFQADVFLTFDNAMVYNPEGSVVYNMAKEMKDKFAIDYDNLLRQLKAEEDEKRKNGDACALCGSEKLLFEPPVFYCNGLKCSSQRIRRNSYYYVAGNNKYHWCHPCYGDLNDGQEIQMPMGTYRKSDLVKKKNDEVREESWVHCDRCNRWIHQICGLFNTRKNKDQTSEYVCPRCTIKDRKRRGTSEGTSSTPMAEDLQRTLLSEFLESHIKIKSKQYFENMAKEISKKNSISIEEATKRVETGGKITIRQVTSMDRKLEVLDKMKKRYAFRNYPSEFNYRCKCLIVFQNIDGVDVILFGMYVYEHDGNNPLPNKRVVYLSYLDSVHFMKPKHMRTYVYHEILVAYLDYIRKKGFEIVHIWACPPGKGDDYILYAKPESQKTPKEDRLRQWYYKMLVEAQKRGIVGKVTNMYDLYFSNPKNDATCVPYLDGDYFPGEVENTIRSMEEGKHSKKASSEGKKKKSKSKNKSGRGGTRSTGIDEEALAASGLLPPGYDQKSIEEGHQDFVMAKVGEIIAPMKDNFIVAYLACANATEENMVVPKDIAEYRDKHGIRSKHLLEAQAHNPDSSIGSDEGNGKNSNVTASKSSEESKTDGKTSDVEMKDSSNQISSSGELSGKAVEAGSSSVNASAENGEKAKPVITATAREGKFAAMEARKRSLEGKIKADESNSSPTDEKRESKPSTSITVKDSQGRLVKVLNDDEEEMDCEFLNTRQLFLELCQTNNYQYDQMRRAKHSSMMVLFHLHNRDAPKFVQQCAVCAREILSGFRYHCPTCADFDLCQECYIKSYKKNLTPRHQHNLKQMPVSTGDKNQPSDLHKKERKRSIQLHMTLLLHAASCTSPKCLSQNCAKMKSLLKHGDTCPTKHAGGCNVCKRIWTLLQIHARQCKDPKCPVPKCLAFRQRFRQLLIQQRAMDDRRRQQMNLQYQTRHT